MRKAMTQTCYDKACPRLLLLLCFNSIIEGKITIIRKKLFAMA